MCHCIFVYSLEQMRLKIGENITNRLFCFHYLPILFILDYTDSSDFQEDSFTVSLSGRTLHFIVGFIKTNVTDITNSSPSVAKLLTQIEKATKELIGHISKLLQVSPLVSEQ